MNSLRDLWTTVSLDPVMLAASLMVSAALLALLLIVTTTRGASPAPKARLRPEQARSLAARGAPAVEIARRTGLSRDAIALVLGATPAADMRKARPLAARFSAAMAPKRLSILPEQRA